MKKNYHISYFLFLTLIFIGCSDENFFDANEEQFVLNYSVNIANDKQSRTVGDGTEVDELVVGVFEKKDKKETQKGLNLTFERNKEDGKFYVSIPLLKSKTYDLVFWAQKKDNKVYNTEDLNNIKIDYSKIQEMALSEAMALDAFSATNMNVSAQTANGNSNITLKRPFTMISTGTSGEKEDIETAQLTLSKVYTSFQPLAGTVDDPIENITLTFKDFGDETFSEEGEIFNYMATAFILVSESEEENDIKITGSFLNKENEIISTIEETPINNLVKNHRYHIGHPLAEGWDGETRVEELVPNENDGIIRIENAAQMVYLLENGYDSSNDIQQILLCKDLDMKGEISRLTNYTLKNVHFNGGGYTLYNLPLPLFGESNGLSVENLTLKKVNITEGIINGALATKVKGSASFTNITIEYGKVIAEDIAGGIIGYLQRKTLTDRSESLEITFNNCHVKSIELSASVIGKVVGEFSGYDYKETLLFNNECTVSDVIIGTYSSPYINDNQSVWLDAIDEKYDNWLGAETYRRGVVKFNEKRLVPKWDGVNYEEPLLANSAYDKDVTVGNNKFVVYSPFDLAGVRQKTASPSAIYLKEDVDMNGAGMDNIYNVPDNFTQSAYTSTDDNVFNPFNYVTTLDGYKDENENYSIYNLSIEQIAQDRAAFILYASGTTTHKNINFRNCQTVAVHKDVVTDAKAYGAILVSNVDATYIMENVHAYDCKVFALQKVGTLGARIAGTSTLKNNSVNNCYVENYECNISERFTSGQKTISKWTVEVYADFYPHGEVGGMYGFIQGNSKLTDCKVNGTTIYAYGQDDKNATVNGDFAAKLGIALLGYYKVPGRHVSTLIGNIRATGTVTLTGCSVDANTQCTKRHDKHNSTYNYIGQAYIVKFVDSEGTVTVDGKSLKLADCNKNTKL